MKHITKQQTGFKFGKYRLNVVSELGSVKHNGSTYKMLRVCTHDNQDYLSLRLYNSQGKFIKQLLLEWNPKLISDVADLFDYAVAKVEFEYEKVN